jgi:hypothetical protein
MCMCMWHVHVRCCCCCCPCVSGLVKGILDERGVLKPNQVYMRLRKKMGSADETEFDMCGEVIAHKLFIVR